VSNGKGDDCLTNIGYRQNCSAVMLRIYNTLSGIKGERNANVEG
jgi:hypothetical protein